MASRAAVFPLLFAAFAVITADYECELHTSSSGEQKSTVICAYPVPWDVSRFCCGTCDDRYCCSDPQKKLSHEAQNKCFLKIFDIIQHPPESDDDVTMIAVIATIVGLIVFSVLFLICWVYPCCILYKKCRNPTPVIATVVTTQFLPPQIVINGGQYPPYQPLPNNPEYDAQSVPDGPYQAQPCVPGPPPPYQEAGPGYPVPNTQPPYISDQRPAPGVAQNQVPTDYTPHPAFSPGYVESTKTGY